MKLLGNTANRLTAVSGKYLLDTNYGKIKTDLQEKGSPIPENDIWIAAIAKEHNFILVTRDIHFNAVQDLQIDKW